MKTARALPLLFFASSALATVAGKGATYKAGDTDSLTRTLEFLKATLN